MGDRRKTVTSPERAINGKGAAGRLAERQEHSVPLMAELYAWLQTRA